jgi:hypothetical protein
MRATVSAHFIFRHCCHENSCFVSVCVGNNLKKQTPPSPSPDKHTHSQTHHIDGRRYVEAEPCINCTVLRYMEWNGDLLTRMKLLLICILLSSYSFVFFRFYFLSVSILLYHHSHHRDNVTAPHGRPNLRSRLHCCHAQEGRPRNP